MKMSQLLAETDRKVLAPWPKGIEFVDDPRACAPEERFRLSRPDSYFARQVAFGGLVSRTHGYNHGPRQDPRKLAEDWILARCIAQQRKRGAYK